MIALPGAIQSFEEFEAATAPLLKPVFKSRFGAMFLDDLDRPGPEHEYFIEDFLTVGEKSVIGGPSRSGKSFLGIHAGMCVATGHEFFGRKVKKGLVVYQAGEGARGVKKRLRAWRSHFGYQFRREDPFVLLQAQVDLYRPDGDTKPLIEEIKAIAGMYEIPLRLIVIDTLATATSGADENSGKDMSAVMANISRINSETGAAVCLVHHMNALGNKLRGHSSIYANVDQVITVTRNEETKIRTVVLDKQKDDEDGIKFQFELLPVEVGTKEDGRPLTSCVVVDVGAKAKFVEERAAKGFKLRDGETLVFKALWRALLDHGVQAPSELGLPLGSRVVDSVHWREEYRKVAPSGVVEGGDDLAEKRKHDANRKALERAYKALLNWNVIGRSDPWVWWTGKAIQGMPETFDRTFMTAAQDRFSYPGDKSQ